MAYHTIHTLFGYSANAAVADAVLIGLTDDLTRLPLELTPAVK